MRRNIFRVYKRGDLSSDHSPIVMELSGTVAARRPLMGLTNRRTNWDKFRDLLESQINLQPKIQHYLRY